MINYRRPLGANLKTKFAIAFYYIAIGFLVACAAVIVVKLIFWPPCTQIGNTCAIDPWSTAGLAGTVLAVAATLLAILGAVSVAAWWTSLNDRVNEQVTKLYETQKAEINTQVDTMLAGQREKVDVQLEEFQTAFRSLEASESILRKRIDLLHKSTQDVEEMAIDGLTSVFGAGFLEKWAQNATKDLKFPRIPLRMAENYLDQIEHTRPRVEGELVDTEKNLKTRDDFFRTNFLNATLSSGMNQYSTPSLLNLRFEISKILENLNKEYTLLSDTFTNWDGALHWSEMGMQYTELFEPSDEDFAEPLAKLQERFKALRSWIEQQKENRDLLVTKAKSLLSEVTTYIEARQTNEVPEEETIDNSVEM
jgi:hypothetical protein